ncbi:MAG TPA: ECF transporter S component [Tissierellaceae bacterium]|nr:ECF transporter S component [Tissierellaceae bacterium]
MIKKKRLDIRKLTVIGVLGAISVVLGLTPLGFIPIGPTRATIMHIPVIIGAIVEGPIVGAFVGLIFGLSSIYQAITAPTPVSFVFLNPLVSVLPRVLIGITTYYTYKGLSNLGQKNTFRLLNLVWVIITAYLAYGIYQNIVVFTSIWPVLINIALLIVVYAMVYLTAKKLKSKALDVIVATVVGTMTNTVGVLTMIYLLFGERFVEAIGQSKEFALKVIVAIGVTNGIPESIIAIIIVTSVVVALKRKR